MPRINQPITLNALTFPESRPQIRHVWVMHSMLSFNYIALDRVSVVPKRVGT